MSSPKVLCYSSSMLSWRSLVNQLLSACRPLPRPSRTRRIEAVRGPCAPRTGSTRSTARRQAALADRTIIHLAQTGTNIE